MRIKFKAPDPRRGTVAEMDSARGQELIDSGAAVLAKDDATSDETAPAAKTAAHARAGVQATAAAKKTTAPVKTSRRGGTR